MRHNRAGKLAEFLAKAILTIKFYKIVTTNYITGKKTGSGEIDIVACKKNLIVFVEVKQRKKIDIAANSISPAQQQRIIRGAESFLKKNSKYQNFDVRFDAFLVSLPFRFCHIKDAWRLS